MKMLLVGAAAAVLLHITPTVILVKREDAVAKLLPGAERFAARELHLSSADSRRLHDAVGWEPPHGVVDRSTQPSVRLPLGFLTREAARHEL